jgi:hypothetical protein
MCVVRTASFVYTWPETKPAEELNREFYEQALPRYVDTNYSAKLQRLYAKDLRELRPWFGGGKLLEIGCNVGGFLHAAGSMAGRRPGSSRSRPAPSIRPGPGARRHHRHPGRPEPAPRTPSTWSTRTPCWSTSQPPFRPRRHRPRPQAGGIVYTKTVNFDCYTREQIGLEWKLLAPNGHVSLFNARTLARFNEQAGLDVIRVQSNGVRVHPGPFAALRKGILSFLSRRTLKGDRIIVWARKPEAAQ